MQFSLSVLCVRAHCISFGALTLPISMMTRMKCRGRGRGARAEKVILNLSRKKRGGIVGFVESLGGIKLRGSLGKDLLPSRRPWRP